MELVLAVRVPRASAVPTVLASHGPACLSISQQPTVCSLPSIESHVARATAATPDPVLPGSPSLIASSPPEVQSHSASMLANTPPPISRGTSWSSQFPSARPSIAAASPASCRFPLAGQQYRSNRSSATESIDDDPYRAVWTSDGRLWQPHLPAADQRLSFAVAVEIPDGGFSFDGIEATLYLDLERNGQGSNNPTVASHENGRLFSVHTNDGAPAWALVEGDGGPSAGFQLKSTQQYCS